MIYVNIAILLAAGTGSRTGLDIPKQFVKINNKYLLSYSIDSFIKSKLVDDIYIVVNEKYKEKLIEILTKEKYEKINLEKNIIIGGSTRQQSVFNGLEYLKNLVSGDDIIAVHDTARAMIDEDTINECIITAKKYGSSCAYKKAVDTISIMEDEYLSKTLNRDSLAVLQTPQCFKFDIIYSSHINALKNNISNSSDDTNLVSKNNYKIKLVESKKINEKITTLEDIENFKNSFKKEII